MPALLLGACVCFVLLGRWQLERAEVNRSIEIRFSEAAELPVLVAPVSDAEESLYRRIRLEGRYRADQQILLDNMTHQGRAGFEVLTPFVLDEDARLILVNRGFVPAGADRGRPPGIALADVSASVSGRVGRLPRAALDLDAPPVELAPSVVLLSFPEWSDVEAVLGRDAYPFVLLLDADQANGFSRDWQVPDDRDERNIAYAVQWFALGGLALVIAFGAVLRQRQRKERP